MRMNTTNGHSQNSSHDFSISNLFQKKANFPPISPSPKNLKIMRLRKMNSLSKRRLNTEINSNSLTLTRCLKINPNIKMVNILNFEEQIDNILSTDLGLEKQKEKIDNNKTIKLIRLGLYKKKEKENSAKENNNDIETIAEKEKENENDLEKIDIENRDKERKLEKKLKEQLNIIEQMRNDCQRINAQINNVNKTIEDYQIEKNVLTNYAEEFDQKIQEKLNGEKNNENEKEIDNNNNYIDDSPKKKSNKPQPNKLFEHLSKMIIIKQQREEKKKILDENILIKESVKQKLEKELIEKRNKCNEAKKELYKTRKNLINSYHLKLYEGLDFHGDGLSMIIKDIWNLGVNVNISFMPTYLDGPAIDFLFKKARQSIELNKIRQVIKENETELAFYLKDWKKNNKEINNFLNRNNQFGLNDNNKNDENKSAFNENELFKTKVNDSEISLSYLEPYPKTKQFMIEYKKKHPHLFHRDAPKFEIKNIPFKSLNIPLKITEKNKHIEKLKYLLEIKIEQNKQKDKKEVERLNKEFIKNDYKQKYEVNVETVFGALFGEEKKNEMLIYYARLEKEFRDGKKIIQFHTKLNLKLK